MTELFEVVLTQSYQGQACLNRWNYITDSTPAGDTLSESLAKALGMIPNDADVFETDTLFFFLRNLQHTEVNYVNLTVRNVYVPTDFYDTPYAQGTTGNAGGPSASPAVSYGFRSSRSRTDIRRGFKRFVGVSNQLVGDGGFLTSAGNALTLNVANALGQPVQYDDSGNTLTYEPVVVSKEKYPVPNRSTEAYRYYPDPLVQLENIATSLNWTAYPQVRTQTSRQYGRGA